MTPNQSLNDVGLVFETSWEVCNKIGGIYTVLSTKARELQTMFPDRVIFIGPDVWTEDNPSPYFKERKSLFNRDLLNSKLPYGLKVRVGRWDIPGSPIVVLVDFKPIYPLLNEFFAEMWNKFGVDSLQAYGDYDEGCAFGIAASMVIKTVTDYLKISKNAVIAHFDEWTTGMGLLYTKAHMPEAATIFTTHATSIGRSICGNGKDLYKYFHNYNGDQMARELNMVSKHSVEKAAAANADCFTTVSEVTSRECRQLLDVPVDVVTPNGFEPDFIPTSVKYRRFRKNARTRLLRIASIMKGEMLPEDTFIIATSGRNEYRNKGLDLFLDSMALLGEKLRGTDRQALAIVAVPAWVRQPNPELAEALSSESATADISTSFLTHHLNNEESDNVTLRIAGLQREGLSPNIQILFVPCYLDGHDGIVDISYYDLLPALDLTIFPSYYEPWGYTPLESVAFSVPTITTDKAGFGQWVLSELKNSIKESGVKVIERDDDNYHGATERIATVACEYLLSDGAFKTKARAQASLTAEKADWKFFIKDYVKAFSIAMANRDKREN